MLRNIARVVERLGQYVVMPFAAPSVLPIAVLFLVALASALYGYL